MLPCLSLARHDYQGVPAPSVHTAGSLAGSGQVGRDWTCSRSTKAAAAGSGLLPPWRPADPWLPVLGGTFRGGCCIFPKQRKAQRLRILAGCPALVSAKERSCGQRGSKLHHLFSTLRGHGLCQPGPGAAPSYPMVPTTPPSFPPSPQSGKTSLTCLQEQEHLAGIKIAMFASQWTRDGRR